MEVKCPLSCICSPAPSSLMINMSSLARLSLSCSQFSQSQPGASFALAVQDLLQLQIAPGFFYPALSGCCVLEGWSGLSLYYTSISSLSIVKPYVSPHLPSLPPWSLTAHSHHHKSGIEIPEFGPRSEPHLQGIKTFLCMHHQGCAGWVWLFSIVDTKWS